MDSMFQGVHELNSHKNLDMRAWRTQDAATRSPLSRFRRAATNRLAKQQAAA